MKYIILLQIGTQHKVDFVKDITLYLKYTILLQIGTHHTE
jgi:hypothetical protein